MFPDLVAQLSPHLPPLLSGLTYCGPLFLWFICVTSGRLKSVKEVLCYSGPDLQRLTSLPTHDVQHLLRAAALHLQGSRVLTGGQESVCRGDGWMSPWAPDSALGMMSQHCPSPSASPRRVQVICPGPQRRAQSTAHWAVGPQLRYNLPGVPAPQSRPSQ